MHQTINAHETVGKVRTPNAKNVLASCLVLKSGHVDCKDRCTFARLIIQSVDCICRDICEILIRPSVVEK
jgi:hypothetical protein